MNKILSKILLAASLLLLVTPPSLHAADLSVGATTWYTAWDFEWDSTSESTYEPGLLYGPVVSLAITPDLSLSFVFLYGKFEQTYSQPGYEETSTMTRYDSDFTLNYRISNYFKLFAGTKIIRFTWDGGEHKAIGPGAGISSIFPVGGNLFLLGNISGLYLYGEETVDPDTEKLNEYGYNGSIALAYYIPDSLTTISLGGRYQYVEIDYEGSFPDNNSRFYGVTLTAVYTFNI